MRSTGFKCLSAIWLALLLLPGILYARDVRVTVYNSNLGVVRDTRSAKLERGVNLISMDEIAAQIDPTSVRLNLDGEGDISVIEQNFEYDLVNPDKLLQKYLEERLSITTEDGKIYEGKLIGFDGANLVLDMEASGVALVSRDKVKDIVLPLADKGLVVKPTLFWHVNASRATSAEMELAYLTDGMNWHAEYVATVGQDEKSLGLASWVSVENQSGATYPDAKLKLIAGDIHRAREKGPMPMYEMARAQGAPQIEEKAFFEYHMYTLEGTTTIKDKEVKQIQLFPETTVPAAKLYNFDASKGTGVRVVMKFENSRTSGLGIPLPMGKVRVFKADTDGSLEFLGEDEIDHTPRDEEVKLYVGDAFDVVVTREQKEFNRLSDHVFVETYDITIANHKDAAITLAVTEHIYGEWTIRSATHTYKKLKSDTAEFEVPVGANAKVILTYTVRREV
ncbi:MAG: DUF4139 domain-containing protein [Candidatus Eisenbacteria bacterium]